MVTANAWPPAWLTPVPDTAITAGKGESVIDFAEIFGIITKDSIAGKAGSPLILRENQISPGLISLSPLSTRHPLIFQH